jgi:hypothetical protein
LVGTFSADGCGRYMCLQMEAGPVADGTPRGFYSSSRGLFARVTRVLFTPDFVALGATRWGYTGFGGYQYQFCGGRQLGEGVCDQDVSSFSSRGTRVAR